MKKILFILMFAGLCISTADAQKKIPHSARLNNEVSARRTEIILPQVKGFNVYKGDFHIHTTYSDGRVNPGGRVTEAWYDGLDVIAITDHYEGTTGIKKTLKVAAPQNGGAPIEYKAAKQLNTPPADFNAIHEEAASQVEKSGLPMLLIKGCEMARNAQTHGHFNALFLDDINTLYDPDMAKAFEKVKKQGGIIIHNHPAWRRKTSDKTEFHEKVYSAGLIDGVEVVNGGTFYPHIVRRCLDEKLTMFGNTDEHGLTAHRFTAAGLHRTMTLIFAKDLTEKAIKDAILKRRTLVYAGGYVIGDVNWLGELLNASVDCRIIKVDEKKGNRTFQLTNHSSITYRLQRGKTIYELEPFKSLMISVGKDKKSGKYVLPKFRVNNMWQEDYKHPNIEIALDK
jgi:predicted metal-dependent phosphoesterase TrpH